MIEIKDLSKNGVSLYKYSHEKYMIKNVETEKRYTFIFHDNPDEKYVITEEVKPFYIDKNKLKSLFK